MVCILGFEVDKMRKGRIGNLIQAHKHAAYTFERIFSTLNEKKFKIFLNVMMFGCSSF